MVKKIKKIQNVAKKLLGLEETGTETSSYYRTWVNLSGGNGKMSQEEKNGFATATVRAIVSACCNGEIQLKTSDGSVINYDKKGKNPLLDLLYRPNPYFNENIFKQIIVSQLLYWGNVYILKDARDSQGRPTRLIPIPKPNISPMLDYNGYPYAYKIATTQGGFIAPKEDIIHIYEGNANDLFIGHSRMKRCQIDSDIMNEAKGFNLSFFRNGASVGGVITFPEGQRVNADEAQELLAHFNDQHQGSIKAHRTAILQKGGKFESFGTTHKDMDYSEGLKYHQQQILSIAGVPPAMVGLFEFAPQFNTKEQQKIFYEANIIPLMRLFADAFSEELVPDFIKDESVYITYDFSKVKALEPDWNILADAVLKLAQKFPLNEVKNALGLPFNDVEGGDEPPSPILNAFSGLNIGNLSSPKQDVKDIKDIKEIKDAKKVRTIRPTPAQIKRHKLNKAILIEQQGEIMRGSIENHFNRQMTQVKAYISKLNDTETLFDYNACFGSINEQVKILLVEKVPAMAQIFSAGIKYEQEYLQSLAPNKDYNFTDKKSMQDRVQHWAELNALKWAESIEKTTFDRIDRIIKLGLDAGMSNKQINNIILQFFSAEGYEPTTLTENENGARISILDRVKTIVATETRNTISEAQLEAFNSTHFVNGKGWITTMGIADHHEGHLEMDGQEVLVNDYFINPITQQRTQAPGQFGTADQDINCLCDLYPIVID